MDQFVEWLNESAEDSVYNTQYIVWTDEVVNYEISDKIDFWNFHGMKWKFGKAPTIGSNEWSSKRMAQGSRVRRIGMGYFWGVGF